MTKTQLITLPTDELKAIVRSTKPEGTFWVELKWVREELRRRGIRA